MVFFLSEAVCFFYCLAFDLLSCFYFVCAAIFGVPSLIHEVVFVHPQLFLCCAPSLILKSRLMLYISGQALILFADR